MKNGSKKKRACTSAHVRELKALARKKVPAATRARRGKRHSPLDYHSTRARSEPKFFLSEFADKPRHSRARGLRDGYARPI